MTLIPFKNRARERPRIRPIKAFGHFRKLIANKEDTTQVFYIIQALDGGGFERDAKQFMRSEVGQKRWADRRDLVKVLDDHETLKTLPEGSVGREYLAFMQREGLSAAGLVEEYDRSGIAGDHYGDQMEWYGHRRRDTHDLFHVLTGYGRDALGEACVLGFSYGQNGGRGGIFIAYMAALELRKTLPRGSAPLKAVWDGQRCGKRAGKIVNEDIVALLAEPLDAARARLGITPPRRYEAIHSACDAAGLDPYAALSAA